MGNEREAKELPNALSLICRHCGNQLEPRKFEFDDRILWGIFDNCEPFEKQMLYDSLQDAILAFNGVPDDLLNIEKLMENYKNG